MLPVVQKLSSSMRISSTFFAQAVLIDRKKHLIKMLLLKCLKHVPPILVDATNRTGIRLLGDIMLSRQGHELKLRQEAASYDFVKILILTCVRVTSLQMFPDRDLQKSNSLESS